MDLPHHSAASSRGRPTTKALPSVDQTRRVVTSSDADDHARNLSSWNQRYDQFSPGTFVGQIAELWLPDTQLYLETTSQVLHQSCSSWVNSLWFGIPVLKGENAYIGNQQIPDAALAMKRGGADFKLVTPANFQILGISIDEHIFTRYLQEIEHIDRFNVLDKSEVLQVDMERKREVVSELNRILFENNVLPTEDALHLSASLQDQILMAIVPLLVSATVPEDRSSCKQLNRMRIVEKMREYYLQHIDEEISIPDFCRYLKVSRRTLQYCTEDVVGMSPAAFIRCLRLNSVRRELFFGDRDTHITDVAMSWGFWHLSQFAAHYRKLFDMLPSETLNHAKKCY